jgi:hypothetical protein
MTFFPGQPQCAPAFVRPAVRVAVEVNLLWSYEGSGEASHGGLGGSPPQKKVTYEGPSEVSHGGVWGTGRQEKKRPNQLGDRTLTFWLESLQ